MAKRVFAADPIFEANPRQIDELLQSIHTRALALPDFQRDFVWEPKRTAELLRSVMCRYPAGSLLTWRVESEGLPFAAREVEGAPALGNNRPRELVLDGQQRLTALYQALMDVGDEVYYLRLSRLISPKGEVLAPPSVEWDEAVVWYERDSREAKQATEESWQFDQTLFPVSAIWEFDDWLDKFVRRQKPKQSEEDGLKRLYREIRDRYLAPLRAYGFPVITLPATTALEAVCTVFEALNRTGKPLGPFELLTARFYPSGVNLRDLWTEAIQTYPILDESQFDIDPYNLLQAVSLRANNSAQRADVLSKLKADEVSKHWPKVVSGTAQALDLLEGECGVLNRKLLPYSMILVPMAAVWPEIQEAKSLVRGAILDRLKQYFWCTVFSANYDQGANSQAGADYARLKEWLFDPTKVPPEAVANFSMRRSTLQTATVRRKALYTGLMALTVRAGAKDFHLGQGITRQQFLDKKIDSHHVFPKGFLKKAASELALNRALIDADTNRIIGSKAPSKYIADIEQHHPREKIVDVLSSHLIDADAGAPLLKDDYEGFIEQRLNSVIVEIERLTGGKVLNDQEQQN